VHEQQAFSHNLPGEFAQEIPAFFVFFQTLFETCALELLPGPEDGSFRSAAETFRIK
jgi:hypothetical protein